MERYHEKSGSGEKELCRDPWVACAVFPDFSACEHYTLARRSTQLACCGACPDSGFHYFCAGKKQVKLNLEHEILSSVNSIIYMF